MILLAASVLLIGTIAIVAFRTTRGKQTIVHIGYLPIYVDLPLFVAYDRGFFEKHGVRVKLDRFATSPDLGTALSTNSVQVVASIAFAVALSAESRDSGKTKVFMVDSENEDNYLSSIVVMPGSGIAKIEDLKGKRLGSFPGPQATTFLKLILEKHGLNPDRDLQLTELQSGSHLTALKTHTIDALFTYEPISTQAVQQIGAIKLVPGAVEREIISPWQAGVWGYSSSFGSAHPADVKAVVAAIYDAVDFIRLNPAAAKTALNAWANIEASVAVATPTIPFAKLGEVDLTALQRQADILHQRGIVSRPITASALLAPLAMFAKPDH